MPPEDEEAVSNAQVFMMLEARKKRDLEQRRPVPEVVEKTFKYAEQFATASVNMRAHGAQSIINNLIRDLKNVSFDSRSLDSFEVASLINLYPDSVEEAKALVPSLASKFNDDELQQIISQMGAAIGDLY